MPNDWYRLIKQIFKNFDRISETIFDDRSEFEIKTFRMSFDDISYISEVLAENGCNCECRNSQSMSYIDTSGILQPNRMGFIVSISIPYGNDKAQDTLSLLALEKM